MSAYFLEFGYQLNIGGIYNNRNNGIGGDYDYNSNININNCNSNSNNLYCTQR